MPRPAWAAGVARALASVTAGGADRSLAGLFNLHSLRKDPAVLHGGRANSRFADGALFYARRADPTRARATLPDVRPATRGRFEAGEPGAGLTTMASPPSSNRVHRDHRPTARRPGGIVRTYRSTRCLAMHGARWLTSQAAREAGHDPDGRSAVCKVRRESWAFPTGFCAARNAAPQHNPV